MVLICLLGGDIFNCEGSYARSLSVPGTRYQYSSYTNTVQYCTSFPCGTSTRYQEKNPVLYYIDYPGIYSYQVQSSTGYPLCDFTLSYMYFLTYCILKIML